MSTATTPEAGTAPASSLLTRTGLVAGALVLALIVAAFVGARYGLLLLIGLGFGIVLEGFRFGFAGPWRQMITKRDPGGTLAQLLSIALVAIVAIPLLADAGGTLVGARAPVGFAMVGGAFVFGACMQIVMGCGSGTLVNAGSGNPVSLLALPFFAIGSFAGAYHLLWWTELGTLPLIAFDGTSGLMVTLALLAASAGLLLFLAAPGTRRIPRRLWIAAALLAGLALFNLVVAGQPWGVVYGLGLWAAKGATALGADISASSFWGTPGNMERVSQSLLTDVTSLTNLGIIGGAFLVAVWRSGLGQGLPDLPKRAWVATVIAGFLLGYSSRIAFGCNVGAFFSGISTGSLHGWAWFVAAFGGAFVGVKLRPVLGLEGRR
ncbi:YeeE/YedE family protein [Roseivivax sp. THAF30]|uniref:YeeE/YedE family protein n=1 Tax=Roseivivax sp. THAF30 TaxID=2587852 RepID=UPI001268AFF1|nr:YeeE/YedE family protein [Roseivivax sp. THAF30]QFT62155.1 putative inner membrane protein [Roseivivax sp. THAF30]